MGTSGCAFRLNWGETWDLDNVAIVYMSSDAGAPHRRANEALGITSAPVVARGRDDEDAFKRFIVHAISELRKPVLAHGVVGPPEGSLITGYDEGGDVLLGWSYFQGNQDRMLGWWGDMNRDGVVEWIDEPDLDFEPTDSGQTNGYFRKRKWFPSTFDASVLGERDQVPSPRALYRDSLEWALQVIRTPKTHRTKHNGLAAYEAWARDLEEDSAFPLGGMALVRDHYMVHQGAACTVAEGRQTAAWFFERVARALPEMATELGAASTCYRHEYALMRHTMDVIGDAAGTRVSHDWVMPGETHEWDQSALALAEAKTRREIAPLIREAQARDREAAEYIERALSR
jgi:hypothetical protein